MTKNTNEQEGGSQYFSVSPIMLFPETHGNFRVYLKQGDRFVLYSEQGERFTEEHRKKMYELGVKQVHILAEHRNRFRRYVEDNLGEVLASDFVPMEERAKVFYDASLSIVKGVFSKRLPKSISEQQYEIVSKLVRNCAAFLSKEDALRHLGGLIKHDYKLFRHSVNVFVFSVSLLNTYVVEELVQDTGIAAILHDIGKQSVPKEVLRKTAALTAKERSEVEKHPVRGVSMCASAPVSPDVINGILFHHEKIDGTGYPSGMSGEELPFHVCVLAVTNAYDNLLTGSATGSAMTPFQALKALGDDKGYDPDVVKRFILMLSEALPGLGGLK
jgi:HD-GYP domain-containing protein (c-di-GMP phosphodiesterase class II)